MELMLVAAGAILLPLDALRMETLVLHGEVVAVLTLAAGEDDLLAGHGCTPYEVTSVRVRAVPVG
jgi:hypothetical protein